MNSIKLTINKREFTFSFGLGFLGELLNDLNLPASELGKLEQLMQDNPFSTIPTMMYHSAVYGLRLKGEVVDFNKYQFFEMLDQDQGIANDNVVKYVEAFTNSLVQNVPIEEVEEEGSKKK